MTNGSQNYKLGELTQGMEDIKENILELKTMMEKFNARTTILERFNERLVAYGALFIAGLGFLGGLLQDAISNIIKGR